MTFTHSNTNKNLQRLITDISSSLKDHFIVNTINRNSRNVHLMYCSHHSFHQEKNIDVFVHMFKLLKKNSKQCFMFVIYINLI